MHFWPWRSCRRRRYLEGRTQRLLEELPVARIRELRKAESRFLALLQSLDDEASS